MCNEIGGILFDLTPANIVGKYPGKSGLIMLTWVFDLLTIFFFLKPRKESEVLSEAVNFFIAKIANVLCCEVDAFG